MPMPGIFVRALPRQDMCGNAIQKPTVVTGNYRASRETLKSRFQTFQGFDIKVIGRLIQKQQISPLLERKSQVQTVLLATGKYAGTLLLIGTFEA